MSERDDGGPAFPKAGRYGFAGTEYEAGHSGMSLRDYIATQALSGMLANPRTSIDVGLALDRSGVHRSFDEQHNLGALSYRWADWMLVARKRA